MKAEDLPRFRTRLLVRKATLHDKPSQLHLTYKSPQNAIPDVARRAHAAIVVMGSMARSGLKQAFIGNTAERSLGAIHCDVLVVKPAHVSARVDDDVRGVRLVSPQIPYAY